MDIRSVPGYSISTNFRHATTLCAKFCGHEFIADVLRVKDFYAKNIIEPGLWSQEHKVTTWPKELTLTSSYLRWRCYWCQSQMNVERVQCLLFLKKHFPCNKLMLCSVVNNFSKGVVVFRIKIYCNSCFLHWANVTLKLYTMLFLCWVISNYRN